MSQKTVFVIGAGASKEVDLPIGSELKKSIANTLTFTNENTHGVPDTGDRIIIRTFLLNNEYLPLFKASEVIRRAMPQAPSIDNFLDIRSNDELIVFCGKLAIVRTILEAEGQSRLSGENIDFDKNEDTWFNSFFQQLTENCKSEGLKERLKSIALIIFNYDRCIEHYLYHAIQNYYSLSSEETVSLLKCLDIFHPYGVVGLLPWQTSSNSIQFGATPKPEQLIKLSQRIKTFTEGTDESSSQITSIRSYIETSRRLIFLGFAFHPLNMDILFPIIYDNTHVVRERKNIYATFMGISLEDQQYITEDLKERLRINKNDMDLIKIKGNAYSCAKLFELNKRGLSFVRMKLN